MHRFYVPTVPCDAGDFLLPRGDVKKILRVLKLNLGEQGVRLILYEWGDLGG